MTCFSRRIYEVSAGEQQENENGSFFLASRSKECSPSRDGPRERRETAGRGEGGRPSGRPDGAAPHYYTTLYVTVRYVRSCCADTFVTVRYVGFAGWCV